MRRAFYAMAAVFVMLSPVAAAAAAADFTGRWDSNFGIVELTQKAASVSGMYACCGGGRIEGRVADGRLQFKWQDPVNGDGWGSFVLSSDGNSLDGFWAFAGQEKANGNWRATRLQAAGMRGTPTYWTVSGVNAQAGALDGTAELFMDGDKVTGKIEGRYSGGVPGQGVDIFNYVEGTASEGEMRLRWRNPVDGTSGTMDLRRSSVRLAGPWQSNDGTSRGTISLAPAADGSGGKGANLDSVLDRQAQAQRAEQLLHGAAESASSAGAVRRYQEAERLFRELGDTNKVGYALYGRASDELNRGRYDEAKRLYQQVLALGDAVEPTIRELAQTGLSTVAIVQEGSRDKDYPDTLSDYKGTETVTDASPALDLKSLAFQLALQGNKGCVAALPMLSNALALYRQDRADPDKSSLLRHGSLIGEITILTRLAYCNLVLGHDDEFARSIVELVKVREEISRVSYLTRFASPAGGSFQQIAGLVDAWRRRLPTDKQKKKATERIRRALDEAVRFLAESGNPDEALALSENMRGRAFADLLASKTRLMESIRTGSADTADIASPAATDYLPLNELRRIVTESGSTTIVYHLLDDELLIWIVAPRADSQPTIEMITVPGGERTLRPLLHKLQEIFSTRGRKEDYRVDQQAALALLQQLYAQLIGPLPENLLPTDPGQPLTIVPHEALFLVPFAALARPGTEEADFLVDHHALATAPSIAILGTLQKPVAEVGPRNLLAFVNPKPLPAVAAAAGLHPLDSTEQDFDKLASLYPDRKANTVLTGERATSAALDDQASRYAVLYFATHAQADDQDPLASWIALAGSGDTGKVTVAEVLTARLNAELVILAACETGGGVTSGDGVDGLGRAFLFAGSRALLTSLWQASDDSTLELLYDFHKYWLAGMPKAEALRRSQSKMSRRLQSQPEFWANFMLVGDWR